MSHSTRKFLMLTLGLILAGCSSRAGEEPVRVKVHGLQAIPGTGQVAVVLADDSGKRFLPISVGGDQAVSILLGRKGESASRPLSHDLMAKLLETLNGKLERVTITELKDDTYFAEMVVTQGKKNHRLDARPSDAIALALRTHSPIYVMPNLLSDYTRPPTAETGTEEVSSEAWGFTVQTLTGDLSQFFGSAQGVLVADVRAESPAGRAGLSPGDIVIRFGRSRIRDLDDFREAMAELEEKTQVEVVVERGKETLSLRLAK